MPKDLRDKCRTCLGDSPINHQLFDYVDGSYKILDMLDGIVPQINIKVTSQLSTRMCQTCVDKLLTSYKFQQLCIKTNNRLQELLGSEKSVKRIQKLIELPNFDGDIKEYKLLDGSSNWRKEEGANDTDSSNENLSITKQISNLEMKPSKKLNLKKIVEIKIDEESEEEMDNKLTMIIIKEETTVTPQTFEESNDDNIYNDFEDKTGTKAIRNTDLDDTIIGEIEKPRTIKIKRFDFPCNICGKEFDRACGLKRHSNVHSLSRPHECQICKYRFNSISMLKIHACKNDAKTNDYLNAPLCPDGFKCPDCPRRFEKLASLSAHRQIHSRNTSQPNYACMVCQRNFMSTRSVFQHITLKHPEVEQHKCNQCDKIFIQYDHLTDHLNQHKDNTISENDNLEEQQNRTHSGKNPYLCPQCGKAFRKARNLRDHIDRHSDLKKYQCPKCSTRFNSRSDMLKHAKIHSNVKPHVCDMCGLRFRRSYTMQQHKLRCSGNRES